MAILKPKLERLAQHLMFSSDRSTESFLILMEAEGVEFRKNKNIGDIYKAIVKAKMPRIGRGKVEFEQNMLECYLDDILKEVRKAKK